MGAIAGPLGLAMQGLSLVFSGLGERQAARHKAAQADRAKKIGYIQADQISTDYTTDLASTIANIRAIRAATGANPYSPSTEAFIAEESRVSDRTRRIRSGAARMEANQYGDDAAFYRSSAKTALLGRSLQALPYFLKAAA